MLNMSMKQKIGQRIVVGFPGYEIPAELENLVKEHYVANFILFSENIRDKSQAKQLCADLQALTRLHTGTSAFITIDQEGGVVSRLGSDAAVVPSAMCISASGNPKNAYKAGYITGSELAAIGINFDLAPNMDVNSNDANPVIGVRSYGDTPQIVSIYGTEMIRGLMDGGVLCCAKHFPGHGDTAIDSHLSLPLVDKTITELEACELAPFRAAIAADVPAIMTTHILFPHLEPEKIPATMSRHIITDLLKEQMGFEGLVLSDCMMMQAIQKFYGTVDGMVQAIHAGVDLVFTSHSMAFAKDACIAIEEHLHSDMLSLEEMDASVQKILMYKAQVKPSTASIDFVGCTRNRNQVKQLMNDGISVVHLPETGLPAIGSHPLFLGCHPFRPTIASNPEDFSISFPTLMQAQLSGDAIATPVDPTDSEIDDMMLQTKDHTSIVIGTYNGHIKKGQLRLVHALAKLDIPVICVALRNPYDLLNLPQNVAAIAAYQYDKLSIDAIVDLLKGKLIPAGKLPLQKLGG